jgi:3-hydroxy-9,10-secoandrosta-1,3,5(10)-triene-9,17-dione monooxygenase reductase component
MKGPSAPILLPHSAAWSERELRDVLGYYCSGLTILAAVVDGGPVGLTCQSFFSVSLQPPLVAVCVGKKSTSFPAIRSIGSLSINILASDQRDLSDSFARSGGDKWTGVAWRPGSVHRHPIIENAVASLECDIVSETDAGDHVLVLAHVRHLRADASRDPLLYFRGTYRKINTLDEL